LGDASLLGARLGEAAALATAVCWTASACFFAAATRHLPAQRVNQMRLLLACAFLQITLLGRGLAGAEDVMPGARQGMFLLASGAVGLWLGDVALFRAFEILDTRRVLLVAASAPVFVLLLAVPALGETLGAAAFAGMALTLGGIAWVVAEKEPPAGGAPAASAADAAAHRARQREGVLMAALAAVGQAAGAVLARAGLGQAPPDSWLGTIVAAGGSAIVTDVSPLAATAIRMIAGAGAIFAVAAFRGQLAGFAASWRQRPGAWLTAGGTTFGPFVGVWLSLVAFAHTEAAIAQTLMALQPVIVLPFARRFLGERVTPRAVLGALVAVCGAGVLAFRAEITAAFG
jgi:drug/metabolite transporter (DMT)-like permease